MKGFFIISIFLLLVSPNYSIASVTNTDVPATKRLMLERIRQLKNCGENSSDPCCSLTEENLGLEFARPDYHYELNSTAGRCDLINNIDGRKRVIRNIIQNPPQVDGLKNHYQNIFCGAGPSAKPISALPLSTTEREIINDRLDDSPSGVKRARENRPPLRCNGRFRIGCLPSGKSQPSELHQTYCSGNFQRIFGAPGEQNLNFLRTINPAIPETIQGMDRDKHFTGGYAIPAESGDGGQGGGGGGGQSGGGQGGGGGGDAGTDTGSRSCTLEKVQNSTMTDGETVTKDHGQEYGLECNDNHTGAGTLQCDNGTFKRVGENGELTDGEIGCTPRPSPPHPDPPAPPPPRTDRSTDPPPAARISPQGTEATSRRGTTDRARAAQERRAARAAAGSDGSAFAGASRDSNPCVQAAKERATAAAVQTQPQLPTKQTCEKANRAFAKALKQMGNVRVNGQKFKELQQKRDELKRRKALYEDMDTFTRDYRAALNGLMNSANPQEAFNKFNKTRQMNEFLGLSSALDNIIQEQADGGFDPSKIRDYATAGCEEETQADNQLCLLLKSPETLSDTTSTKGAVVQQVIDRFGNAFQKAFTCRGKQGREKQECDREAKLALEAFHEELTNAKSTLTEFSRIVEDQSARSLEIREHSNIQFRYNAKINENIISSFPSLHGLGENIPTSEELKNFFQPIEASVEDTGNPAVGARDSFIDWVKRGCAQRARQRYANGENYQEILDSYKNNPEKAMTDFLNDITTELSSLKNCGENQPEEECPNFCSDLSNCLQKLNEAQTPNQITAAKQKIDTDLAAIETEIEQFKANPEFNNKKVFAQNLADYVSFCNEHARTLEMKETRKTHPFCPSTPDQSASNLELLLDDSGEIITQIDPLIQMGRNVPSDQLYVLSGTLANSCRMTRYGEMQDSSSEAREICAEASTFTDRTNESSCQGQLIAEHIRKGTGDCSYHRSRGTACTVNDDGSLNLRHISHEGVGSWGEFITESLSQITSSTNIFGAAMTAFGAHFLGFQADALRDSPLPDAIAGFNTQRICDGYASASFHQQLFTSCSQVVTQNPIMATQAGLGPVAATQPYGGVILSQLNGPRPPCANAPPPMFQSLVGIPGDGSTSAQCVPLGSSSLTSGGVSSGVLNQ